MEKPKFNLSKSADEIIKNTDPVKRATGKNLNDWYNEFKGFPFVVISFIAVLALIYQNYSIKSNWQNERAELKGQILSTQREMVVKDSISQVRLERSVSFGQERVDRLQASKDSLLILYGAKKALER